MPGAPGASSWGSMPSTTTLSLRRDACARRSAKFIARIIAYCGKQVTTGVAFSHPSRAFFGATTGKKRHEQPDNRYQDPFYVRDCAGDSAACGRGDGGRVSLLRHSAARNLRE